MFPEKEVNPENSFVLRPDENASTDLNNIYPDPALIDDDLGQVDIKYPLSGGETDEDLDDATEPLEDKGNFIEEALSKIDTDFPLSGGETDEDLEKVEEAG